MRKILTPKIDAENRQRDLELQKQRKILVKTLNDSEYHDDIRGKSARALGVSVMRSYNYYRY